MGWSLKGILAGAGKGVADWAGREIAAEKQAERDAAQFERQKELNVQQDELLGARKERELELMDRFAEKKAAQERERETETLRLGDEDAKAAGFKPGTKEYNLFMGDFLRQSNFTTLGEKYVAQADKFDDNDLRRRQIEGQLAAVAESRRGREDAKAQQADAKQFALDAKQIETLGSFTTKITDPDTGKPVIHEDKSGQAALINLYQKSGGNMELVSEAGAGGQALFRSEPEKFKTLGSAVEFFAAQKMAEAKAKKSPVPTTPAPTTPAPTKPGILGDGSLSK